MTLLAASLTIPPFLSRLLRPGGSPDPSEWRQAIEGLRREIAADRATHAQAIADEQAARQKLSEALDLARADAAAARVEVQAARADAAHERRERELLQGYVGMLQKNIEYQTGLMLEQGSTIGELKERLTASESSRERMGQRLGLLETQVADLPPLRERALKAEMTARIWRNDSLRIRALLVEAGGVAPELPDIPDVPDPPQVEGGSHV